MLASNGGISDFKVVSGLVFTGVFLIPRMVFSIYAEWKSECRTNIQSRFKVCSLDNI